MGSTDFFRWFLLPGSLDAFAAGGLVAWVTKTRKDGLTIPYRWRWAFLGILAFAWGAARTIRAGYGSASLNLAFIDTLETLVFAGLLIEFLQYQGSMLSRAFSNRTLCFIGKISYGLYLWHMLVAYAVTPFLDTLGWGALNHPFLRAGALISASILTAWTSWVVIEQPFVNLGQRLSAVEWDIQQRLKRIITRIRISIRSIHREIAKRRIVVKQT